MTAWLAGGGDFYKDGFTPAENDKIIAVDAGYAFIKNMGLEPDLVVGDFDSLAFVPKHPNIEQHPSIKDDTDTMLAVKKGIETGCSRFLIFGGTGGRIAHTFGNIQVLAYLAEQKLEGYIIDRNYIITAAQNCTLNFGSEFKGYISLFPWGAKKAKVTLKGLKYELEHAPLPCDRPLGISNEFTGAPAEITAYSDTTIIIFENHGIMPEREERRD